MTTYFVMPKDESPDTVTPLWPWQKTGRLRHVRLKVSCANHQMLACVLPVDDILFCDAQGWISWIWDSSMSLTQDRKITSHPPYGVLCANYQVLARALPMYGCIGYPGQPTQRDQSSYLGRIWMDKQRRSVILPKTSLRGQTATKVKSWPVLPILKDSWLVLLSGLSHLINVCIHIEHPLPDLCMVCHQLHLNACFIRIHPFSQVTPVHNQLFVLSAIHYATYVPSQMPTCDPLIWIVFLVSVSAIHYIVVIFSVSVILPVLYTISEWPQGSA